MVLIFRYRGHQVSLLLRLIATRVTHTDITDQEVTQAGEEWRENQELLDTMNDPLPLRTRLLSFLIYRLTKRLTNPFHPHRIQRKKKTLKATLSHFICHGVVQKWNYNRDSRFREVSESCTFGGRGEKTRSGNSAKRYRDLLA